MKKDDKEDENKDVDKVISEAEKAEIEEKRKKVIEEALTKGKLARA
jgi:hypothetical protein